MSRAARQFILPFTFYKMIYNKACQKK